MRSFGPQHSAHVVREPFDFWVMRDDEPEKHSFQARVVTDIGSLMMAMTAGQKNPERAMVGMQMIISKMLDNKDGVPARWEPIALEPPEDAAEDHVTQFRGPDGNLYPLEQAERFSRFEDGSSRRRWLYLMNEDDEVVVQAEDLVKLLEWLVKLAAGRPTGPSSS